MKDLAEQLRAGCGPVILLIVAIAWSVARCLELDLYRQN